MQMIKKLSAFIGKYKVYAILSPILVFFEVVLEVFIPLLMGRISWTLAFPTTITPTSSRWAD